MLLSVGKGVQSRKQLKGAQTKNSQGGREIMSVPETGTGPSLPCGELRLVLKSLRGRQKCSYHSLQQAKATDAVRDQAFPTISLLSETRRVWFHELGSGADKTEFLENK